MISGSLMMILFWGGLIVLIVLAVRWAGSGASQGGGSPSSTKRGLDTLRERFARGEIDKNEFDERKRLLAD
ncbi:MAG TPA: SHOCT domain-containing protein [Aurantimonas coralicida]|uniref:SHOCT domain-containing protein n=2 Tax=root TaxID=1 RepID=A0A9C9TGQ4_9HYPH|nr:SHOCT domain-containing protein [Aurantimonas coralicida]HET99925.1 SHOCT domain-containing protein [Aurantimonas coralicida]